MTKQSRRGLLGLGARSLGVAALAGVARLSGQTVGTNRVLIAIDLIGGEDSNSLLVPLESQGYSLYASGRGALAVPRTAFRPVESVRQQMAFGVPAWMPEVASLYGAGALAFVANVGDLPFPMSKVQFLANTAAFSDDLFSHSGNSKRFYGPGATLSQVWSKSVLQQSQEELAGRLFSFKTGVTSAAISGEWLQGPRLEHADLVRLMESSGLRTQFPATAIGHTLSQAVRLAA